MPKTYEEIDATATAMRAAKAPDSEVKRYVELALQEMEQVAAPAAKSSTPQVPYAALGGGQRYDMGRGTVNVGGIAADMALEGGGATAGQALGAATGPLAPVAIPALGALGGAAGNWMAQQRQISSGDRTATSWPEVGGAAVGGMIPGATGPKMALRSANMAKEVGKNVAGNIAATAAESGLESGELPSMGRAAFAGATGAIGTTASNALNTGARAQANTIAKLRNSPRDKVIVEGLAEGYSISPTHVDKKNPALVAEVLESIGGKAASQQAFSINNQEVTNKLARRALGIPSSVPQLSQEVLDDVRKEAGKPFEAITTMATSAEAALDALKKNELTATNRFELEILMSDPATVKKVSDLSAKAAADVRALSKARYDVKSQRDFYKKSGNPEHLEASKAAAELVEKLQDKLEDAAKALGHPELVEQIRLSRKRIAQSYQIEKALTLSGDVDASVLRKAAKNGAKLTDELDLIARFEDRFGSEMRQAGKVPSPGVHQLPGYIAGTGVTMGIMSGRPELALLGLAAPFAVPRAARTLMMSRPFQNTMSVPRYGTEIPDAAAQFARFVTLGQGRDEPNPFMQFLQEQYPAKQVQPQQAR